LSPDAPRADNKAMPTDLQTVLKLSVPVIVQIGRRSISLESVLGLGPGAIVELDRQSEEPLDLLVNNEQVGRGTAVKVGENFGIRITEIGPPSERIEAMGQ